LLKNQDAEVTGEETDVSGKAKKEWNKLRRKFFFDRPQTAGDKRGKVKRNRP